MSEQPIVHQNRVEVVTPSEKGFKPDLGLQAGILAGRKDGRFSTAPVDEAVISDKLRQQTGDRWDFQGVNLISKNERRAKGVPQEKWAAGMQAKIDQMNPKQQGQLTEVIRELGFVGPDNAIQLNAMMQKFCFSGDNGSDTKAFLEQIVKLPGLDKHMNAVKFVAASLFGAETAGTMIAQMTDLEARIKAAGGDKVKLNTIARQLSESSKQMSEGASKTIDTANTHLETTGDEKIKLELPVDEADPESSLKKLAGSEQANLQELQKDTASVGGFSDLGTDMKNHPNQEDRYGFKSDDRKTVAVVADGVTTGGNGDKAAEEAVLKIVDRMMAEQDIAKAFDQAKVSISSPGETTVVAAALGKDGVMYYANAGDSRLCVIEDGQIKQLSHDDSAGEHGEINSTFKTYKDVHVGLYNLKPGGVALLLTDGVYKMLNNDEIVQIVAKNKDKLPAEISQALVNAAKAKGTENATAVTLKRT